MARLWQQRLPGTRQAGHETDRGCSLSGRAVDLGSLASCLAFLLLRPTEDTTLFSGGCLVFSGSLPTGELRACTAHYPWLSFPEVLSKDMPQGFMGKVKINT